MSILAGVLVAAVAALQAFFMVLEMFLWTRPFGLKTFRQSAEKAQLTAALAKNQGLYNGFLSAGLIWGLLHPSVEFGFQIKIFFLLCVLAAGIYGAWSVSRGILVVQGLPALLSLLILLLA